MIIVSTMIVNITRVLKYIKNILVIEFNKNINSWKRTKHQAISFK